MQTYLRTLLSRLNIIIVAKTHFEFAIFIEDFMKTNNNKNKLSSKNLLFQKYNKNFKIFLLN